ncbi:MAG TPA: hypothetical protein VKV33_11985, partial [Streptosporangiaceae bacterium]|nr:hypothetical protein [Streptosporangiaceae bacterium]
AKKRMPQQPDDGRIAPTRPQAIVAAEAGPSAEAGPLAARKGRRMGRAGLLGLLTGVLALVTVAQTPPGHSFLRLTGLAQPPAAYSALYFTNPGGLTTSLPSGHVSLNVPFAVHNASQSATSYRWTVQVVQGKKTHSAVRGASTIAAGGTKAEDPMVTALCPSGVLEVVVHLAKPAESISFRAVCGG